MNEIERLQANPSITVLSVSPLTEEEQAREDARLVTGRITVDGDLVVTATYDPTDRWNGWIAAPWVDAENLRAIQSDLQTYEEGDQIDIDAETGEATFLTLDDERDVDGIWKRNSEPIARNEQGLYNVGFGWVWTEATDEDEAQALVAAEPEVHERFIAVAARPARDAEREVAAYLYAHTTQVANGVTAEGRVFFILRTVADTSERAIHLSSEQAARLGSGLHGASAGWFSIDGAKASLESNFSYLGPIKWADDEPVADTESVTDTEPETLVIAFDVSGWTEQQVAALVAQVSAQAEAVSDSDPSDGFDFAHDDAEVEVLGTYVAPLDSIAGALHVGLDL